MHDTELSIVLPAYMEEENLRLLLPRVKAAAAKIGCKAEILVVDAFEPRDRTECVCAELGIGYTRRDDGPDYGFAIVTGIRRAQGKYLVFMDADGSHTPEFVEELFRHRNSYDVVIASRYVAGGATENSPLLILMSKLVNLLYSLVLNLQCKDVSNSFKLYRREHLQNLTLTCRHFDIVEEILFKLKRRNSNLRILEVPFTFKERIYGKTKRNLLAFAFAYFATIIRLRFSK